jgi:hypothetical protein
MLSRHLGMLVGSSLPKILPTEWCADPHQGLSSKGPSTY